MIRADKFIQLAKGKGDFYRFEDHIHPFKATVKNGGKDRELWIDTIAKKLVTARTTIRQSEAQVFMPEQTFFKYSDAIKIVFEGNLH